MSLEAVPEKTPQKSGPEETHLGRVANIERVMAVLESLVGWPNGRSVGDLAEEFGLPKSAISRTLGTLQGADYVLKDPVTGHFSIALKLISLVNRHLQHIGVEDLCQPVLRNAAQETGELVQLALVGNDQMYYVMKAEGPHRVWTATPLGAHAPLHATAAGKAWIAYLPSKIALKLVLNQGMRQLSERTITDPDQLLRELEITRERGYALNVSEVTLGVNSLAVPVWHPRREKVVIGSVVLTAPEFRIRADQLAPLVPALRGAADKIGELLPASLSIPTEPS